MWMDGAMSFVVPLLLLGQSAAVGWTYPTVYEFEVTEGTFLLDVSPDGVVDPDPLPSR